MKRIILITLFALAAMPLWGQRLSRGEKMPDYQVKAWISASQPSGGKATLVEFFHSGNKVSVDRLAALEQLAKDNSRVLNVLVVTREDTPEVRKMLGGKAFHAAVDDDGKTFSAFSALYVPYAVLADKKGRVVWLGNPVSLKTEDIPQLIQ